MSWEIPGSYLRVCVCVSLTESSLWGCYTVSFSIDHFMFIQILVFPAVYLPGMTIQVQINILLACDKESWWNTHRSRSELETLMNVLKYPSMNILEIWSCQDYIGAHLLSINQGRLLAVGTKTYWTLLFWHFFAEDGWEDHWGSNVPVCKMRLFHGCATPMILVAVLTSDWKAILYVL